MDDGEGAWAPVVGDSDARVTDTQALEEIALYGEVVIAASASDGPLTTEELDRVLGVEAPVD
ncbi:hypothetical protein D5H78_01490 [Vallicoccus soli]|uniref:Uncharacterized protein n=1 Tax=Vallicoccus soli TaxID=2339232 RepID=A0A3A3Z0D1_9ACTN|nr:hypothetical protein D5H78_01490 [Vallicoccus soli]